MFKVLMFTLVLSSCTTAYANSTCDAIKSLAETAQMYKSTGHPHYEYEHMVRVQASKMEPGASSRGAVSAMKAVGDLVYANYSAEEIYTLCMK